jgi:hypothetical protein
MASSSDDADGPMAYLVLDGQKISNRHTSLYRGTDRREPIYCDALTSDHEINELFKWYVDEYRPVHDLAKALRYVELSRKHLANHNFEVVEVTKNNASPVYRGKFLGFDISAGGCGDSLIFMCLPVEPETPNIPEEPILVLSQLIRRYFTPRLNKFGLFQKFEDATYCRKVMIALQSFHPNLYEGGALEVFEVAGVYTLSEK